MHLTRSFHDVPMFGFILIPVILSPTELFSSSGVNENDLNSRQENAGNILSHLIGLVELEM